MKYLSVIDINNKNNSHTIAIDFFQKHANGKILRVLEVGCSSGYMGAYLKSLGHTVIGIELDPLAAKEAGEVLDAVFCQTIQSYYADNPNEKFDAIFFGDVLEHIADPVGVLISSHEFLKKGGIVIASIPNVAHNAIRAMLLEGSWEYSDLGILDRTHLQFFTKKSLFDLFKRAHYDVLDVGEVTLSVETVSKMCRLQLNQKMVDIVEGQFSQDPTGKVFQFIFVAKSQKEFLTRVVAYVPDTEATLCKIRVKEPLSLWEKNYPGEFRYRSFGEIRFEDLYWGDVFVFQRLGDSNVLRIIQSLIRYGKKVVFEMDDLLTQIPEFLPHHQFSDSKLKIFTQTLQAANLLVTTTDRLGQELAKINENVAIIPNCANPRVWSTSRHTDSEKRIEIVVASSDSVRVDFIVPALLSLMKEYPNRFHITAIGPPGEYLEKIGVPVHRKPVLSQDEFKEFISNLVNPIGLIPLDDSLFSACKSPIKFFDYALAGVPSICSNVPPYSDYVQNGKTGLLVDNITSAWFEAIVTLAHSAELRLSLVDRAAQYVKGNYSLDVACQKWEEAFTALNIQRLPNTEKLDIDNQSTKLVLMGVNLFRHVMNPRSYKHAYRKYKQIGPKKFASIIVGKIKILRA